MSPEERLIRLHELDSIGAALLLAYLDGRVPDMIDKWFDDRQRKWARAAVATQRAAAAVIEETGG